MEYIYPAIFDPNDDGSFTIEYPGLPGCISEGKSLANVLYMTQNALAEWLEYLVDKKQKIPPSSDIKDIKVIGDQFVNLVRVEVKDGRAIRRTISIPKWMDDKAARAGLSLSRVLQDALREKLG